MLARRTRGGRLPGGHKARWKGNTHIIFVILYLWIEVDVSGSKWDQPWVAVDTVKKLQKTSDVLTSWETISYARQTLRHMISYRIQWDMSERTFAGVLIMKSHKGTLIVVLGNTPKFLWMEQAVQLQSFHQDNRYSEQESNRRSPVDES
jgi:hypothetical protein